MILFWIAFPLVLLSLGTWIFAGFRAAKQMREAGDRMVAEVKKRMETCE